MAMGNNNNNNCLVRRTSSFGRKRILILNEMDIDFDSISPNKKQSIRTETSLLQDLPQDIMIRILCGVEHDDLKRLFHVSKPVREAVVIAKKLHFAYSTPKKIPAFRCFLDQTAYDEIEAPNAPRQLKTARSRLNKKKLADISVALFASDDDDDDDIEYFV